MLLRGGSSGVELFVITMAISMAMVAIGGFGTFTTYWLLKRVIQVRERADSFLFLLLLGYSPFLQILGSVYKCFNDDELGWVLVSDPNVSCESGFHRTSVVFHVFVFGLVVGVGFPALIYVQTRGELDAKSPFAQIFEHYKKKVPYWEAAGLLR